MKLIRLWALLIAGGAAFAQAGGHGADTPAQLHTRALAAVQAERARPKQPMCGKAVTTLAINNCYADELAIGNANYKKLVLALGALWRADGDAKTAPKRIPFDDAETAWGKYRDAACDAMGAEYEGGSLRTSLEIGCENTLVRHHIEELWALYSDLWTQ